jgi:hypothetical protein
MRALLLAWSLPITGCSLDAIGAFEATGDDESVGVTASGASSTGTSGSMGGASHAGGAGGAGPSQGGAGGDSSSSGTPVCASRGARLDGSPEQYLEYDPGSNTVMTNSMPSSFVFAIWLNPDFANLTEGRRFVAGRVDEGSKAGWSVHLEPNGRVVAKVRNENGGVCELGGIPNGWPARIRLRYLGGQQHAMRLVADEQEIAAQPNCQDVPILAATAVPFRIGVQPDPLLDDALPYKGEIDNVFYDGSDNGLPPCTGNLKDRGWNFEEALGNEVLPAGQCIGNLLLVGGATVTDVGCVQP